MWDRVQKVVLGTSKRLEHLSVNIHVYRETLPLSVSFCLQPGKLLAGIFLARLLSKRAQTIAPLFPKSANSN